MSKAMDEVRRRLTAGVEPCHWRTMGEDYDCDPAPNQRRCVFCRARDTVDLLLSEADKAIRADEREACAKVADGVSGNHAAAATRMETDVMRTAHRYAADAAGDVAYTIRARGKP